MASEYLTTAAPPNSVAADNATVNLGTVFRLDQTRFIKGVRFYRATGASKADTAGPGGLWAVQIYDFASSTSLLASKTFAGALVNNGVWNEVLFDTPVSLDPTKNYIVSYFSPGQYTATGGFFNAADVVSPGGIIIAPKTDTSSNGTIVTNGRFGYENNPAFPGGTFNGGFYYVEPIIDVPSGAPPVTGSGTQTVPLPTQSGGGRVVVRGTGASLITLASLGGGGAAAAGSGEASIDIASGGSGHVPVLGGGSQVIAPSSGGQGRAVIIGGASQLVTMTQSSGTLAWSGPSPDPQFLNGRTKVGSLSGRTAVATIRGKWSLGDIKA